MHVFMFSLFYDGHLFLPRFARASLPSLPYHMEFDGDDGDRDADGDDGCDGGDCPSWRGSSAMPASRRQRP